MRSHVAAFVARRWGLAPEEFRITLALLPGGLESAVARVRLKVARPGTGAPERFVVKELHGHAAREADMYALLWRQVEQPPAARMFGVMTAGNARYLFLEDLQAAMEWPWRDVGASSAVCRALARLHDATRLSADAVSWDYEADLARSAADTLAVAAAGRDIEGMRVWGPLRELKRLVDALPQIRARLLERQTSVIHGDVHPGNVLLRRQDGEVRVTLIDWSRTRVGSPLEDVASWLHSLGCWEPEARRRHDTLLRVYLDSRDAPEPLGADLRKRYWFASLSNGFAGAIRYHISVLSDRESNEHTRSHARRAIFAWERVVRRAAALVPVNRTRRIEAPRRVCHLPTSIPSPSRARGGPVPTPRHGGL